jgi:hypothetical protein
MQNLEALKGGRSTGQEGADVEERMEATRGLKARLLK